MKYLLYVFVVLFSITASAQTESLELTLENIYKKGLIKTKGFGQIYWFDNGNAYTTIENNSDSKGSDIVLYDTKTGNRSVLVSATQLIPENTTTPLNISDYNWSNDHKKLLLFTNTKRVWRYNTKGDYWVLDIEKQKLTKLGKIFPESTLMFAKFSPDGNKVAYVSNNNIHLEDIATRKISHLTTDGSESIINGTFDWVYEEEFGCRDGFRWSDDGAYIAFWQSNTEGTGTFYMVNNIDSIYSKIIPIPYPKVGTTLSAVKVGVVNIASTAVNYFSIPDDSRNNYLPRMEFIPATNDLLIQQLNRLQNTNHVWIANAQTLAIKNIFTEKAEKWLETNDDIQWLNKGKYFTWLSDKSGSMQLYKISLDGKEMSRITNGNFEIESIAAIDEASGSVYFISTQGDFTQRHLFRSMLNGKGEPVLVSKSDVAGTHAYNISTNANYAIHRFENATTPTHIELVSLPNNKQIRVLEDNAAVKSRYEKLNLKPKVFIKVDLGDVVLDAWMIKPIDFDSTKKYPVIFNVYGEPAGTTVKNTWSNGDLWHQYLANKGYIVMSIDNRGTNVPRGQQWRKSIYGEVGVLAAEDQAAAARKILSMYPFIDAEKVGIWGWSGGGSMTLHCMFRYPELYKTGIAVAFVADQKLYDAVYQERYMGLPDANSEGYKNGSPISYAAGLKGNLLLIHGTGDDNVHYQNCEMLVNELVRLNKDFSMMAYPMRSHGIYERENTTLHLYRTMENFWLKNLK